MAQHDLFTATIKTLFQTDCVKEYRFHPTRRWRIDYALPEYQIALEVEGGVWTNGRHTRGAGFLKDMEKYNTLTTMGWRLLRTTPTALHSTATLQLIRATIEQAKKAKKE